MSLDKWMHTCRYRAAKGVRSRARLALSTLAVCAAMLLLTSVCWALDPMEGSGGGLLEEGDESQLLQTLDEDDLFGASDEDSLFGSSDEDDLFGSVDEDSLFGGDGLISEFEEHELGSSLDRDLLVRDTIDVGGSYSLESRATWTWLNPELWFEGKAAPDQETFEMLLRSEAYMDVRPRTDFRGFGKVQISCPLTQIDDLDLNDVVELREAFVDFNKDDRVFFRLGKHTVEWGVGYFFSPADIVNLAAIDPENPDREREGPVSLKVNVPHGVDNYYLYLIPGNSLELSQLAVAPKAEFVVGGTEFGVGAYYRADQAPRVMASMTTSMGKSNVFAEAVVSYGSDRRFVSEVPPSPTNPLGLEVFEVHDALLTSCTAGLIRTHSDEASRSNTSFACQYFYSGDGYEDPAVLSRNAAGVAYLLGTGALTLSDLTRTGRHYGALSLSRSKTEGSHISVNTFWLGNLSDGSGRLTVSLSSEPIEKLRVTVGATASYGGELSEFSPGGQSVGLSIGVSLGRYTF